MFALSGSAELHSEPKEKLKEMDVDFREKEGVLIINTEIFILNIEPDSGDFGYQSRTVMGMSEEVVGQLFQTLETKGLFAEHSLKTLHIAETLPFTVPIEEYSEHTGEKDSRRRYVTFGDEDDIEYKRVQSGFEFYGHSHEDDSEVHIHEIIKREPSSNPIEDLEKLKEVTADMEICGLDFAGHAN